MHCVACNTVRLKRVMDEVCACVPLYHVHGCLQEDDSPDITQRIPVVLEGATCRGNEQALTMCPGFELRGARFSCRHDADVHLVCSNGRNSGVTFTLGIFRQRECPQL